MNLSEHDEASKNESGTSSEAQMAVSVLLLHQGPKSVCKDQLQVLILMVKRVSTVMRLVHREYFLEEQCSIQISTF